MFGPPLKIIFLAVKTIIQQANVSYLANLIFLRGLLLCLPELPCHFPVGGDPDWFTPRATGNGMEMICSRGTIPVPRSQFRYSSNLNSSWWLRLDCDGQHYDSASYSGPLVLLYTGRVVVGFGLSHLGWTQCSALPHVSTSIKNWKEDKAVLVASF